MDRLRIAGGYTRPGRYPVARLSGRDNDFVQIHEALHRQLDCLTTIGNATALALQGSELWSGDLGSVARAAATTWSEATVELVEGVVNYAAFARICRRRQQPPEIASLVPPVAMRSWQRWASRYDALQLEPGFRDALALHVATFVLRVPIYDQIRDLDRLESVYSYFSEELFKDRLREVEGAVFSAAGLRGVVGWQQRMSGEPFRSLDLSAANLEDQRLLHDLLTALVPAVPSVAPTDVPESIQLAGDWTAQARARGSGDAELRIDDGGFVDGQTDLLIVPGALPRARLFELPSVTPYLSVIAEEPGAFGLVILHRPASTWRASSKYARRIDSDEIYTRLFVCGVDDRGTVALEDGAGFLSVKLTDLGALVKQLAHDRIAVTTSHAGLLHARDLRAAAGTLDGNVWETRWAVRFSEFKSEVLHNRADVEWNQIVQMSGSPFWLVKFRPNAWLDVTPFPTEGLEEAEAVAGLFPAPRDFARRGGLYIGGCAMLMVDGF